MVFNLYSKFVDIGAQANALKEDSFMNCTGSVGEMRLLLAILP